MQTRKVHYPSRAEMTRGVNKMTAHGWLVQIITNLASDSYSVEFVQEAGVGSEEVTPGSAAGLWPLKASIAGGSGEPS